jgi:hypothetical protein
MLTRLYFIPENCVTGWQVTPDDVTEKSTSTFIVRLKAAKRSESWYHKPPKENIAVPLPPSPTRQFKGEPSLISSEVSQKYDQAIPVICRLSRTVVFSWCFCRYLLVEHRMVPSSEILKKKKLKYCIPYYSTSITVQFDSRPLEHC